MILDWGISVFDRLDDVNGRKYTRQKIDNFQNLCQMIWDKDSLMRRIAGLLIGQHWYTEIRKYFSVYLSIWNYLDKYNTREISYTHFRIIILDYIKNLITAIYNIIAYDV